MRNSLSCLGRNALKIVAAFWLTGCGGASVPGTATPAAPSGPTRDYLPNYSGELRQARRWRKPQIAIRVHPSGARLVDRIAHQGVGIWLPYLQNLQKIAWTGGEGEVDIAFVAPGVLPAGTVGRTEVTYRTTDQIILAVRIKIDETLTDEQAVQVIAHEFGHALGMEGHSVAVDDLMYRSAHLPAQATQRDVNTLWEIYTRALPIEETPGAAAMIAMDCQREEIRR